MDSSSSSSSVGFPLSGNPENSHSLPSLSSTIGIPLHENPQSTQTLNQQIVSNGPPTIIVSDAEWNEDLGDLVRDVNFCFYMRAGQCRAPFTDWYRCMHRAIYLDGNRDNCLSLAGVLRDCIFANPSYHGSVITHVSRRAGH